jgi:hypothetical protein
MDPFEIDQPLPPSRDQLPKRKAAENHLLNRLKIVEEEAEDDVEDEDDFYELDKVLDSDSEDNGPGSLSGVSNLVPTSAIAALPPSPGMANEIIPPAKAKGKRGRQAVQPRKARKRTARQQDKEPQSDRDGDSDSESGGKHINLEST